MNVEAEAFVWAPWMTVLAGSLAWFVGFSLTWAVEARKNGREVTGFEKDPVQTFVIFFLGWPLIVALTGLHWWMSLLAGPKQ